MEKNIANKRISIFLRKFTDNEKEEYDGEGADYDYEIYNVPDEEHFSDEDEEYNQNESEDAVSPENSNYDKNNKGEDARDYQGANAVSEELFDAT